MTAPTTLPAEVQAIVRALSYGPSTLDGCPQTAINAAFDHGVIQVDGSIASSEDGRREWPGLHWRTRYALRGSVTR